MKTLVDVTTTNGSPAISPGRWDYRIQHAIDCGDFAIIPIENPKDHRHTLEYGWNKTVIQYQKAKDNDRHDILGELFILADFIDHKFHPNYGALEACLELQADLENPPVYTQEDFDLLRALLNEPLPTWLQSGE